MVFFISSVIILFSCKKPKDEPVDVFTGVVIDQVTGKPVEGASVSLENYIDCEITKNPNQIVGLGTSGKDGEFKISVPTNTWVHINPNCIFAFASMTGYNGCNHPRVSVGQGEIIIKLYHYAQLNLHVKNDTINNKIDEAEIWLDFSSGPWQYPEYKKKCQGKKFDTTFVFNQLKGNQNYSLRVVKLGTSSSPPLVFMTGALFFDSIIKINEDALNEFSVTF